MITESLQRRGRPARTRRVLALFGSTALAVASLAAGAANANDVWNGTGSNDWFTAGNWTPNAVPIATDNVFIGVIAPNPTTVNAAGAVAFNLSVGDPTGGNNGALTISGAGGLAVSQNSYIGRTAGTNGVVTVTGAGATWSTALGVYIGDVGNGQVSLLNGGHITNAGGTIGDFAGSVGALTIDGAGSLWASTGNVNVGSSGQGTLTITNGGQLTADQTYAGGSTTGVITVDGVGSHLTDNTLIQIGNIGVGGQLNITNGGAVTTVNATIGAGAAGQANVTGAGSAFTITNDLSVGAGGILTISGGSAVSVATNGTGVTGTGVINIGAAMGSAPAAPGAYTQYRLDNDLNTQSNAGWRGRPVGLPPDGIVAHLAFDAAFVAPVGAGRHALLEDFLQDGPMQRSSLPRGERRRKP